MGKYEDLTGLEYNDWTILKKGVGKRRWLCRCKCNREFEVLAYHLKSGASTKCRVCLGKQKSNIKVGDYIKGLTIVEVRMEKGCTKVIGRCSCGKLVKTNPTGLKKKRTDRCRYCVRFDGYKDISGTYWNQLETGAIERGIEFDITQEDVWIVYKNQQGRCVLSDLPIKFIKAHGRDSRSQTASVDRTDNDEDYTKENIQILHKKVNFMKHCNSQEEFIQLCNLVAKKHPRAVDPDTFQFSKPCTI